MRTVEFYNVVLYKVNDLKAVEEFNLRVGYTDYDFKLITVKSHLSEEKFGLPSAKLLIKMEPAKIGQTGIIKVFRIGNELYMVAYDNEEGTDEGIRAFILERRYGDEDWQEISYIRVPNDNYILITDGKNVGALIRRLANEKWIMEFF